MYDRGYDVIKKRAIEINPELDTQEFGRHYFELNRLSDRISESNRFAQITTPESEAMRLDIYIEFVNRYFVKVNKCS